MVSTVLYPVQYPYGIYILWVKPWDLGKTHVYVTVVLQYTRNEMGLKLGLKPLFSWFSAVSGGFRGDLDPKTRNLDPA